MLSSGTQEIRSRQAEDSGEKAAGYAEMKSWNCWFGDACAMQKGNDVTRHLSFCGGLRLTKKVYLFVRHIHELPLMWICSWDILKFACHKQTVSQAKLVLVEGRLEKLKLQSLVPLVQIFAVFSCLSLALERTAIATASTLLGNWLFFDFTLSWLTLQLVW